MTDKTPDKTETRLTTNQVARLLRITPERVRQLHEQGLFKDVDVTPLGRLFSLAEVEALRTARATN